MNISEQEHLRNAKNSYAELKEIVMELVKAVNLNSFTYPVAMGELDVVLQTVLLHCAIEDDKIVFTENLIIENLTSYEDVLNVINEQQLELDPDWAELDWYTVSRLNKESREEIANLAYEVASEYASEFVSTLAQADRDIVEVDYLKKINKCVYTLIYSMIGIDGDNIESTNASDEGVAGIVTYNTLVNEKWAEITSEE